MKKQHKNIVQHAFSLFLLMLLTPSFLMGQSPDGRPSDEPIPIGKTVFIRSISDLELCIYPQEGRTKNYTPFSMQAYDTSIDQGLIFNANGSISIAKRPDRCLDLADGKTDINTVIEVVPCTGYNSQKWDYDGSDMNIRSREDKNKCIRGENNGALLTLQKCNIYFSQKFAILRPLKIHLAQDDGKCVDIQDVANPEDSNIQVYDCKSAADSESQLFTFYGSSIRKRIGNIDYCLEVHNGTDIQLVKCDPYMMYQAWFYDKTSTGPIHPQPYYPDKCLSIKNGSTTNETDIQIGDCTGEIAQKFVIE